jgi:hypothetical protein
MFSFLLSLTLIYFLFLVVVGVVAAVGPTGGREGRRTTSPSF